MRTVAPVVFDTLGELPYAAVDAVHMDPVSPMPCYDRGLLLAGSRPRRSMTWSRVAGAQSDSISLWSSCGCSAGPSQAARRCPMPWPVATPRSASTSSGCRPDPPPPSSWRRLTGWSPPWRRGGTGRCSTSSATPSPASCGPCGPTTLGPGWARWPALRRAGTCSGSGRLRLNAGSSGPKRRSARQLRYRFGPLEVVRPARRAPPGRPAADGGADHLGAAAWTVPAGLRKSMMVPVSDAAVVDAPWWLAAGPGAGSSARRPSAHWPVAAGRSWPAKGLVGEQVADAGDHRLVEQPGLDRRLPAADPGANSASVTDCGVRSERSNRVEADPAEPARVEEPQRATVGEGDREPVPRLRSGRSPPARSGRSSSRRPR